MQVMCCLISRINYISYPINIPAAFMPQAIVQVMARLILNLYTFYDIFLNTSHEFYYLLNSLMSSRREVDKLK